MDERRFVSRGGTKLEHALKTFGANVSSLAVLDVGSSTEGFVDCLLQNGSAKVYSVDTAYGELAWKLRQDPRVVVVERQNILFLGNLLKKVDLATVDVTFTSLGKVLRIINKFLKDDGKVIALLKPQYGDQKLALRHEGLMPDKFHRRIVEAVRGSAEKEGYKILGQTESPILGTGGNKEYLIYLGG